MPMTVLPILDSEDFLDDGRIKINSAFSIISTFVNELEDEVEDIASAGIGVVSSGTWEADTISPEYGGTGLSVLTPGSFLYAVSSSAFGLRTPTQLRGDISAASVATEVVAGDGLVGGGGLSGNVALALGTPSTLTGATTNSVSSVGHTHQIALGMSDLSDVDLSGVVDGNILVYTGGAWSVANLDVDGDGFAVAGSGLSSSGATVFLGTPSTITASSGNASSSGTHTHALSISPADIGAASASHTHGTSGIQDLAITSNKLANFSVISDKLAAASVTESKIANLAVTSDKVATGAITNTKITSVASTKITGTLNTTQLSDLSVTTVKLGNAAVTPAKSTFFNTFGASGAIYAGRFNGDGSVGRLPSGWSVSKTATGSYTLTHNLGTANYLPMVQSFGATLNIGIEEVASVVAYSGTSVTIRSYNGPFLSDSMIHFVILVY